MINYTYQVLKVTLETASMTIKFKPQGEPKCTDRILPVTLSPQDMTRISSLSTAAEQKDEYRKVIIRQVHQRLQSTWEGEKVAKDVPIPPEMLQDVSQGVEYPVVTQTELDDLTS